MNISVVTEEIPLGKWDTLNLRQNATQIEILGLPSPTEFKLVLEDDSYILESIESTGGILKFADVIRSNEDWRTLQKHCIDFENHLIRELEGDCKETFPETLNFRNLPPYTVSLEFTLDLTPAEKEKLKIVISSLVARRDKIPIVS